jgi:hypothetical protein
MKQLLKLRQELQVAIISSKILQDQALTLLVVKINSKISG